MISGLHQPAGHVEVGEGLIAARFVKLSRKQDGRYGSNASLVFILMYIKRMEFITYGTVFLPRLKSRLL